MPVSGVSLRLSMRVESLDALKHTLVGLASRMMTPQVHSGGNKMRMCLRAFQHRCSADEWQFMHAPVAKETVRGWLPDHPPNRMERDPPAIHEHSVASSRLHRGSAHPWAYALAEQG